MSKQIPKNETDKYTTEDDSFKDDEKSTQEGTLEAYLAEQAAAEEGDDIHYRSCSLFKVFILVASEYCCLPIANFPWAFATLGLIPGLIFTIFIALMALYTGLVVWEFCLKHPAVRDVCDVAQIVFGNRRWVWYATLVGFILNNAFTIGLHLLSWSEFLNTVADHPFCTVGATMIGVAICFIASLPRALSNLTWVAVFACVTMLLACLLCIVFAGIEDHPDKFVASDPVAWSLWPKPGIRFVDGVSAVLNIMFTFIAQITYPSLMAEMKNPREFHIALKLVCVCEIVLYCLVGSICYVFIGHQYVVSPMFGSLEPLYKKITFALATPTSLFMGVLYCSVTARLIFFRIFRNSRHLRANSVIGWTSWAGVLGGVWGLSFVIAESIPFFSELVSLMSSLFVSYFGAILLACIYFYLRRQEKGANWWKDMTPFQYATAGFNIFIICIGFFLLGPGTYSSVVNIMDKFAAGEVGGPFSCASNGL